MKAADQNCDNCYYARQGPIDNLGLTRECRRRAPEPMVEHGAWWPKVGQYDWCGEWRSGSEESP